jgi:hypothetical protein
LSETLILDEDLEMFLIYVLKSLEKLSNITKIKWPSNCQTLKIVQHQDLMEKINDKLSSNLKNLKGANVEDDDDKSLSREKLIKEIKQYEKFPNDYRHCIFSRHLYMYAGEKTDKKDSNNKQSSVIDEAASNHLKDKFTTLYDDGWRVDQVQIENSFKSILYINEKRKQLVLAFKGVQLEIRDLFLKG